jgi:hypothetical protein
VADVVSVPEATKPETAYELLGAVAACILAEPRRYDQGSWLYDAAQVADLASPPPCGTVACRAGWIVALHDGLDGLRAIGNSRVQERADDILDMSFETTEFFGACALYDELRIDEEEDMPELGTKEYAEAGAAGVLKFRDEYAEQLKARRLADVPPLEL